MTIKAIEVGGVYVDGSLTRVPDGPKGDRTNARLDRWADRIGGVVVEKQPGWAPDDSLDVLTFRATALARRRLLNAELDVMATDQSVPLPLRNHIKNHMGHG